LAETGISVDAHPYFGLTRNQFEAVIRAGFTSNQLPEVLLALWAKEGSNRMLMSAPVAQATTAENAKTLFRCSVYYESLGSDQFLITKYDSARHDNVVDLADAAASRQEQHFRGRVQSLVSAGVLSEDLTSAINSQLTVSSGPPFTVTATVKFYALSLLLMDALFTHMQRNSFAQIGFLSPALNYIQWNIRDFRQFLTSADRHRRELAFVSPAGNPLPLEQWALHTVPRAGEWVPPRTNAVRFLHYLQSYRPIFAAALNLIKPGIEDLQATARNVA
jgi:hypothetical protein